MEPTRDQELLARAIRASGLTPRQYAKRVLVRDPRMIRRWLVGQYQLPKEVRAHLEQLEKSRLEKEAILLVAWQAEDQLAQATREQKAARRYLKKFGPQPDPYLDRLEKEPTRAEDRLEEGAD